MENNKHTRSSAEYILNEFVENRDIPEIRKSLSDLLLAAFCSELELTASEKMKIAEVYIGLVFLLDDIEEYRAELALLRSDRE